MGGQVAAPLPPRGAKGGPPPVPPAVFDQVGAACAASLGCGSAAAGQGAPSGAPQGKTRRIPFFSVKQVLMFAALAMLVIMVDLAIGFGLTIYESEAPGAAGSMHSMVSTLANELYAEETVSEQGEDASADADGTPDSQSLGGSAYEAEPPSSPVEGSVEAGVSHDGRRYYVTGDLTARLDASGAWAMLIGDDGQVDWSYGLPDDVPLSYDLTSAALVGHYRMINDYPVGIWSRTDGLAVVGMPRGSYMTGGYTLQYGTFVRMPFYAMFVFLVDIAIFFAVYVVSKRRVAKDAAPAMQALEDISQGRPVDVHLSGSLAGIGESLNSASRIIQAKDTARQNWVSGVSHDIRTPLSLIMGYAEQISHAADDERMRWQADVIMRQSMRIRDLVEDLNIASKLEYDMQPLNRELLMPARLARDVVAMALNGGLDERFAIELDVQEGAQAMRVEGDERLLKRALSNAINNAVLHNEDGCSVTVRVGRDEAAGCARILVADDGCGADAATLSRLVELMAGSAGTGMGRYAQASIPDAPVLPQTSDGHGLGLALIARIAVVHGGSAQVGWAMPPAQLGQPGSGFAVEMRLPLASAPAEPPAPADPAEPSAPADPTEPPAPADPQ